MYDKIYRNQKYYLQLGRMIVREFSFDIPSINIAMVREHCSIMEREFGKNGIGMDEFNIMLNQSKNMYEVSI